VGHHHFSPRQWAALAGLVTALRRTTGAQVLASVISRRTFDGDGCGGALGWMKTCPGFEVGGWSPAGMVRWLTTSSGGPPIGGDHRRRGGTMVRERRHAAHSSAAADDPRASRRRDQAGWSPAPPSRRRASPHFDPGQFSSIPRAPPHVTVDVRREITIGETWAAG